MKRIVIITLSILFALIVIGGGYFGYTYLNKYRENLPVESEYSIVVEDSITVFLNDTYRLSPKLISRDGSIEKARFNYVVSSDCISVSNEGVVSIIKEPNPQDDIVIDIIEKNTNETAQVKVIYAPRLTSVTGSIFKDLAGNASSVIEKKSLQWHKGFSIEIATNPMNISLLSYANISVYDINGNKKEEIEDIFECKIDKTTISFNPRGIGAGKIVIEIKNDNGDKLYAQEVTFDIGMQTKELSDTLLSESGNCLLTQSELQKVQSITLYENLKDISELSELESLDTIVLAKDDVMEIEVCDNICYRVPQDLFHTYNKSSLWSSRIDQLIPYENSVNDIFVVYYDEKQVDNKGYTYEKVISESYSLQSHSYTGYINTKWKDASNKEIKIEDIIAIPRNGIHIHAEWVPITYTVKFTSDEKYNMTPLNDLTLTYDKNNGNFPGAKGIGYTFDHWTVNGVDYNQGATIPNLSTKNDATVTLTANWKPITYTVKFTSDEKYNMTAIKKATLDYDEKYTLPSATGVGYNFVNWSFNGKTYEVGDSIEKLTTTDGDVVILTANWKPITYTVKFTSDAKYNMTAKENVTLDYDEKYTLSSATGVGYNFVNWSFNGKTFKAGDAIEKLTTTDGNVVTLTANWKPIEYTIEFYSDEKYNMTPIDDMEISYDNTEKTFPSAIGVGYNFVNWSFNGKTYKAGDAIEKLTTTDGDVVTLTANWKPIEYTIEFYSDEKYNMTPIDDMEISYDNTEKTFPSATGVGYIFDYWTVNGINYQAGVIIPNLTNENDTNVTLTANWKPITYTVKFTSDEKNTMSPIENMTLVYDEEYTFPDATGVGYTFDHWTVNKDDYTINDGNYNEGEKIPNLSIKDNQVVTLTAVWIEHTYTIEFDTNGGIPFNADEFDNSITLQYSDKYQLKQIIKTGYTYQWYVDINKNGIVDEDDLWFDFDATISMVTPKNNNSISFVAKWTPISYTVKFESDDKYNMTPIDNMILDYDGEYTFPGAKGVGYTFDNWTVNGVDYKQGATIPNLSTKNNATVTLTANWKPITYTVQFDSDEKNTMTPIADLTLTYDGDNGVFPGAKGVGYTFKHWTLNDVQYKEGDTITNLTTTNGDTITLTAVWREHSYTIEFDKNGGTPVDADEFKDSITLYYSEIYPLKELTKTGYTYRWYVDANENGVEDEDDKYIDSNEIISKATSADEQVIKFVAKWTPIKYTVQFDSDEKNTMTPIADLTLTYDGNNGVFPGATGVGYTFNYWTLNGVNYQEGDTITNLTTINGDVVTLTAVWREHSYTIKFDKDGGTPVDTDEFKDSITLNYSDVYELKKLTKTGYTYQWYIDLNGNDQLDETDRTFNMVEKVSKLSATDDDVIKIKANWTPISYTVKFTSDNKYEMKPIDDIILEYDKESDVLPTPSARGYTFKYWKLDDEHSYDSGTMVKNLTTKNGDIIKLVAVFDENTYSIIFDPSCDKTITPPTGFDPEISLTLSYSEEYQLPKYTCEGYTCIWYIDNNNNGTYDGQGSDDTYLGNNTISRLESSGTITLKIFCSDNMYTVFYAFDDGNLQDGRYKKEEIKYSEEFKLPSATKTGYILKGWTCSKDDPSVVYLQEDDTITFKELSSSGGEITFTAVWTPIEYTVKFTSDSVYDMTSIADLTLTYDSNNGMFPGATAVGYTFNYWSLNDVQYKEGEVIPNLTTQNKAVVELVANWTANTYTIKYRSDDANVTSLSPTSCAYNNNFILPSYSKTGYDFVGWSFDGRTFTGSVKVNKESGNINLSDYDNNSEITFTAVWKVHTHKIYFSIKNATISINGVKQANNGSIDMDYREQFTVNVSYSESNNRKNWINVGSENGNKYTDIDSGTTYNDSSSRNNYTVTMPDSDIWIGAHSEGSCIAMGSLITLADGRQVAVEDLKGDEELLVWNLFTGSFESAPILFIDKDLENEYEVINLYYSDGTNVKVITEHAFWDFDLNQYVFMRNDAEQYIGHWFNKQSFDENGNMIWEKVQLVDVQIVEERTVAYSPVTYGHLCLYVNGMLSMPGATTGFINIFDVDPETLTIDWDKYQQDIDQYGLFTYEEFSALYDIPEVIFDAFNGQYLKVSMGKGLITEYELISLISTYSKFFE